MQSRSGPTAHQEGRQPTRAAHLALNEVRSDWAAPRMSGYNAGLMMVIGLHHAGVHVASLERSIAFYEAVFGLRVLERLSLGPDGERIELFEQRAPARALA